MSSIPQLLIPKAVQAPDSKPLSIMSRKDKVIFSLVNLIFSYLNDQPNNPNLGTVNATSLTEILRAPLQHCLVEEGREELEPCQITEENIDQAKGVENLATYFFSSFAYPSIAKRLNQAKFEVTKIDGKILVCLDHFFTPAEGEEARQVVLKHQHTESFPTSDVSVKHGEKPPKALPLKTREKLLLNPPIFIDSLHKLFAFIGTKLDVHVSLHPWHGLPSHPLANNFLTENDEQSENLGWHMDYDPLQGILFSIGKKFDAINKLYPQAFLNGIVGNPYLLSVILYTAHENFKEEWRMGTQFRTDDATKKTKVECKHMRMAIFAGDIYHGIEASHLPKDVKTWRNTFVWRICLRPRSETYVSIAEQFEQFILGLKRKDNAVTVLNSAPFVAPRSIDYIDDEPLPALG